MDPKLSRSRHPASWPADPDVVPSLCPFLGRLLELLVDDRPPLLLTADEMLFSRLLELEGEARSGGAAAASIEAIARVRRIADMATVASQRSMTGIH